MRGNFVDVPTDCPQRDERLGWTGDLAVFAPTAAFLYDTAGMLRSWLADLAVEQLEEHDGVVPIFVPFPDITPPGFPPLQAEAGWGDAAIVVPVGAVSGAPVTRGCSPTSGTSMTAWLDAFERRAGADLDFPDGRVHVRRLAGHRRAAGQSGGGPYAVAVRRHRLPRAIGANRRRRPPRCSGETAAATPSWRTGRQSGSAPST